MKKILCMIFAVLVLPAFPAVSKENPVFSVKAGIGTDVNLGIALGGGFGYLMEFSGMPPLEVDIDYYYYHGLDTSKEQVGNSLNTYNDTTTLRVFAVTANLLHGFQPEKAGFYFITGAGAGAVSLDWKHQSPEDTSYNDSGSSNGGGILVNLGAVYAFGRGFEIRLLAPILVFNGPLDTLGFAPMLNLTAALRF